MNTVVDSTDMDPEDVDAPLAELIYQRLLDAIYQGQLQPGSVVNEMSLAQEFGVSRGPVREAVRRLQGIQLVTRKPYAKSRVISLSPTAVLEIFELRQALEGMACNLAARRMADADLDALLNELETHHHPLADKRPKVFDFHERIVRGCGNSRIVDALCGDLYHLLRLYRRQSTATVVERKEDAYEEHWQIVQAMKSRNASQAESLMRTHISRATENIVKQLNTGNKP